jgi:hypothetical protein
LNGGRPSYAHGDYNAYVAAEKGISHFIQTVVDEVWYKDLRNALTFYNNVTAYDLLEHLVTNSGGLHSNELVNLPAEMLMYYEESDGIPEFLLKLAKTREKLARGGLPMSDEVLLATASSQVFRSMHFPEATREWERLPAASKTWAAWQTKYREAHLERKRLLLANPGGFGGAAHNVSINMPAMEGYLSNMTNAASINNASMATLLAQVQALTANNNMANAASNNPSMATLIAQVQAPLIAQVQALTAKLDNLQTDGAPVMPKKPKRVRTYTQAKALKLFDPTGYCHTHGHRVSKTHNSNTCKYSGPNHDKDATRTDTKGGSVLNKGWETNPNPM